MASWAKGFGLCRCVRTNPSCGINRPMAKGVWVPVVVRRVLGGGKCQLLQFPWISIGKALDAAEKALVIIDL